MHHEYAGYSIFGTFLPQIAMEIIIETDYMTNNYLHD